MQLGHCPPAGVAGRAPRPQRRHNPALWSTLNYSFFLFLTPGIASYLQARLRAGSAFPLHRPTAEPSVLNDTQCVRLTA